MSLTFYRGTLTVFLVKRKKAVTLKCYTWKWLMFPIWILDYNSK